jgi:protease I
MSTSLENYKVAILVANGFEEFEMTKPRTALNEAGAVTHVISPEKKSVRSWINNNWSNVYDVDIHLDSADSSRYDALLLPGGVINPDILRLHPKAINFIAKIGEAKKPIAAICHGPWTLINAGLVKGKTVTSWPSIRIDLENAGATWVDKEAVVDDKLVTSRQPDDIPAFNKAMIELCLKFKI